jgi:hypothetical protein
MTMLFLVRVSRPIEVLINISNREQRIKDCMIRNPNSPVETYLIMIIETEGNKARIINE